MHQEYTIKNYYLEQQNSSLKQELSLKQNTTDKYLGKSVQVNIKILVTLKKKEKGKKTIDVAKKKDTGCKFINSDIPPTTCSINEQQR